MVRFGGGGAVGIDLRAWSHQWKVGIHDEWGARRRRVDSSRRAACDAPRGRAAHVPSPWPTHRAGGGIVGCACVCACQCAIRCCDSAVVFCVLCRCTWRTRSSPPGKAAGASTMISESSSSSQIALVAFDFSLGGLVSSCHSAQAALQHPQGQAHRRPRPGVGDCEVAFRACRVGP